MKARKNFIHYLILNTVFPGVGQLLAGYWGRGLLMMVAAGGFFFWALFSVVAPLWYNVNMLLSGQEGEIRNINLKTFLAATVALLLVWGWSLVDAAAGAWLDRKKSLAEEKKEGGQS